MYNIPIAPFLNVTFYVVETFWNIEQGGTPHRGVDLDPHGSEEFPIYSIIDGTVIDKGYTSTAGNYVIIKGNDTQGTSTRMLHFRDPVLVNIGDRVSKYQLIGYEGNTGQSQGTHLHLEMKYLYGTTTWVTTNNRSDYIDPCSWLGFPNVLNTAVRCDYTPPTPTRKTRFPWFIYANKFRKRANVK